MIPCEIGRKRNITRFLPRASSVCADIGSNVGLPVLAGEHILAEEYRTSVGKPARTVRCGHGNRDRLAPRYTVVVGHLDVCAGFHLLLREKLAHSAHAENGLFIVGLFPLEIRMSRAVVVIAKAEPRNDHFSVSEAGNAGVAVVEVRIVHDDRTGPCFSVVEADEHSVLSDGVDVLDTEARCGRIKNSALVAAHARPAVVFKNRFGITPYYPLLCLRSDFSHDLQSFQYLIL